MADLPDNSFVKVNNVETAQQAPVSEALVQKFGTNENTLDAELTVAQANIATNTANIATNAAAIATGVPVFFDKANLTLTAAFQVVFTFASTPTNVVIQDTSFNSSLNGLVLLNAVNPLRVVSDGVTTIEYQINGSNVEAKVTLGSAVGDDFFGWGYL